MAAKTCYDCLFFGTGAYCHKIKHRVDCDDEACSLFMDFYKTDSCYDCKHGKDKTITFWCSANNKFIKEPDRFHCDKFREDDWNVFLYYMQGQKQKFLPLFFICKIVKNSKINLWSIFIKSAENDWFQTKNLV